MPSAARNKHRYLWTLSVIVLCVTPARAQVSAEKSFASLSAAKGLGVALWAGEPMVNNPTSMDIDSRGRVWIAEGLNYRIETKPDNPFKRVAGADKIKILADTDGDGRADKVTVFADDIFPVPMGLAIEEIWRDGKYRGARVYTGNSPDVLVLEDTDGDDHADRRYALLSGFGGRDSDHGVHGMVLGPDGRLYFTQGDARYGADKIQNDAITFDVVDKSGRRLQCAQYGTTLRVNLDGSRFEVLAYRQRNNYETSINSFGEVFTSDNDDDGERGCRMLWITDGGNYGYRTPQSARHWAEELPGIVPKLVGTGNGSPCGILVYEGDLLGEQNLGAVLQLDAGTHQVNLHPLTRHASAYRTLYDVLLKGEDDWFRPVDATVAPDGSLYVCDWYDAAVGGNRFSDQTTGRIYRLAAGGGAAGKESQQADFATLDGLIDALKSPNIATRFAARQTLLARGAGARDALFEVFRAGRPHHRARALFVLADLPGTGANDVIAALADDDARIRATALRILARDLARESVIAPEPAKVAEPAAVAVWDQIAPLADDPDPGVRRELILALRNVETARAGDVLLKLAAGWDGQDRYYLEALRQALKHREGRLLEQVFALAAGRATSAGWSDEPVWLPPFYPVTTNDAFLHVDDSVLPANAASKLIGLAWALGRAEALEALRTILENNDSPDIARGADMALRQIDDPRAAELLIDRFGAASTASRQREILLTLASRLDDAWQPLRNSVAMHRVLDTALEQGELQVDAIGLIARCRVTSYCDKLLALAQDDQQPLSSRAAAIEALGTLGHQPAQQIVNQLVGQARGAPHAGPLASAALSAMSHFQGDSARQTLVRILGDDRYAVDFRRRATQMLGATTQGAQRLIAMYRDESLPESLKTDVAFSLHNHPDRNIRRAAREAIPLPETAGGKRIEDLAEVLAMRGDVQRGRKVFYRDRSDACARCHRVQGTGNWVGPDLSSIGTKYGKQELLYHILNPSGAINYNYTTYTLALTDGRILSGLITQETPAGVVLKTALGERLTIDRGDIEVKSTQDVSIMPENLAASMAEQDLADLLAYMATLRLPVGTVGEYWVLGPLATGTLTTSAPPDLKRSWPGSDGSSRRWQRLTTSRDDHLELSSLLGSNEKAEVNCYVRVISDRAQSARLVLNTSNTTSLWHNGRRVELAGPEKTELNTLWQATFELARGANDLVIRVQGGPLPAGLISTLITDHAIRFSFDGLQNAE